MSVDPPLTREMLVGSLRRTKESGAVEYLGDVYQDGKGGFMFADGTPVDINGEAREGTVLTTGALTDESTKFVDELHEAIQQGRRNRNDAAGAMRQSGGLTDQVRDLGLAMQRAGRAAGKMTEYLKRMRPSQRRTRTTVSHPTKPIVPVLRKNRHEGANLHRPGVTQTPNPMRGIQPSDRVRKIRVPR